MPCTAPALLFLEVLLAAAAAAAVVVVAAAEEDFGISQIACCVTILRGVAAPKELRGRKTVGCKKRQWDDGDGESIDFGQLRSSRALPATSGWGRRHKMTYVCTEARVVLPGQERGQAARQAQDQRARGLVAKVNWSVRVQATHARARTTRTRTTCARSSEPPGVPSVYVSACTEEPAHYTTPTAALHSSAAQCRGRYRVDISIPPVFRPAPDLALAARRTC